MSIGISPGFTPVLTLMNPDEQQVAQAKSAATNTLERPKPFDHSNTAGGKPVGQT